MEYLLRGIPKGLWRRVKSKAAMEDRTISLVILALLERWLEDDSN